MSLFSHNIEHQAIILTRPNQWQAWLQGIRLEASLAWEYIDPNADTHPVLVEPEEIQYSDVREGATSFAQLQPADLEKWKMLEKIREQKKRDWREARLLIDRADKLINKSICEVAFRLIESDTNPLKKLRKLKTKYAPTDSTRCRDAEVQYQKAKKLTNSMNITNWLDRFQIAVSVGMGLGIPDTADNRPQRDFLAAIHNRFNTFYSSEMEKVLFREYRTPDGSINPSYPSLDSLIERFDIYLKESMQAPPPEANLAFATTFRNETHHVTQQTAQVTPNAPTWPPCPCGHKHAPWNCWYLHPDKAKQGFVENPETRQKVDNALKDFKIRRSIKDCINQRNQLRPTSYSRGGKSGKGRRGGRGGRNSNSRSPSASPQSLPNTDFGTPSAQDQSTEGVSLTTIVIPMSTMSKPDANKTIENLQDKWMLDPGSNMHVCNSRTLYTELKPATPGDIVITGGGPICIHSYGTVKLKVKDSRFKDSTITLYDVAYVPGFITNLVSLAPGRAAGIHFDSGRDVLYNKYTGKIVCRVFPDGGHWYLSQNTPEAAASSRTTLPADVALASSRAARRPITASRLRWHHIMGHPSPDAVDHLTANTIGAQIDEEDHSRAPSTLECWACIETKLQHQVSRRTEPEHPAIKPFERISMDLIQLVPLNEPCYNGDRYTIHAICTKSKYHISVNLPNKSQKELIRAVKGILRFISN